MSLELITTPNKIFTPLDSRAAGALLQLPYTFQRQDYLFNRLRQGADNGRGGNYVQFVADAGQNLPADAFEPGQTVFAFMSISESLPTTPAQQGIATVVRYYGLGSGNYALELDGIDYEANTNGFGYANNLTARPNYKVEIRLFDESGNSLLDNVFRYAPDPAGKLFVNLGTVLSDYLFRNEILSQLYKIAYNETYQGLGPPVFFAGSGTANSGAILFVLDPSYGNLSTQFVGQNIYLTCNEFTGWAPANSVSFGSGSTRVNFLQSDVNNVASLTGDIQTPAIGQPEERAVRLDSDTTQATFAAVGNYTEKGSNLVDYLLRVGGSEASLKWPPQLPFSYPDGAGKQWDKIQSNELLIRLENAPLNTSAYLFTEKTPIPAGTKIYFRAVYRYQVSSFISEGTLTIQVVTFDENGTQQEVLLSSTIDTITGDVGFTNRSNGPIELDIENPCNKVGVRFTQSANANIDVQFNANLETNLLQVYATYPKAKLLTQFKNPILWRGWARTVGLLMDSNFQERTGQGQLKIAQAPADINKNILGGAEFSLDLGISPDVKIYKFSQGPLNEYTVIRPFNNDFTVLLGEEVFYRVLPECSNPIMVEYYNQLGVPEQHLFNITQEIELQATEGTGVTTPVNQDLAGDYSRRIGRRLPDFTQQILCTAENLLPDQYLALQELIYSSEVFIYLDKDGTKKLPVILSGEPSTSKETKDKRLSLQVTLELPLNVRFEDIKLY